MKTKITGALLTCTLLAGCATTTQDISPAQFYRPQNSDQQWRITGNLDSEFTQGILSVQAKRVLHVHINGEKVIAGQLSVMGTGELSGTYQNHSIVSSCTSEQKTQNWIEVRCMILVDNERAATLTF